MRKIKKMVALATCTVMAISAILTGCGNSTEASGSNNGTPTTLTWYTIGEEPKDLDKVLAEANKYLEEKINANINMKFIGFGDYNQKMSVVINSGEDYDLAFTSSWAGDYLGNSRKGAFLELDDYLNSDSGKDLKEAIDPRFWEGATIDGKVYAAPNQKELGVAPMWVFTKEYVDKYNIPYQDIHSLEDLEPWLKVIKENEPDVVPLYITKGFSYGVFFDSIVDPVGIESDDTSLTIKNIFETQQMKDRLNTLRKYYQAGYINADSATAQDDKSVKRFVTKADGQPYADELWSKSLNYPVVSSPIVQTLITNGSTTGSLVAISSNSKNKDKAFEFLSLLNTDKTLRNIINFGVEGLHYEKVGEDHIKILNPEQKNYDVPYFSLGNLFITYKLEGEPDTKWEEFKEFNDNSIMSPALGFKFDSSSVSNEIAAINNVIEEFKSAIFSGSVDVDEYLEKLNAKLKEQGVDRVIAEMQKQIDEWKETR
ncbi:ABC transporter substrate-binding protein [Clostridium sp.]|uniref:ABC transporter substrate-binding protein n=1 Tax=Clostridium sp. TaxID=1506 RepID=UPI00291519B6|nr:ABC transporter substrate-binding protein [Clostridium sp.]MDU5107886.1 ABC transporter substrate-binding protein [Clostridium sp.]